MLKHIVMWKLKPFAEGVSKSVNTLKMKNMLEALQEKIDCIKNIEVGIDISKTDSSYDIALHSEFLNKQALQEYLNHPDHVLVAEFVGKVRENRIVVDYEV